MSLRHPASSTSTGTRSSTVWISFRSATGLDLRIFEDAITFKIALMVVKYMKYMENQEY